MGNVAEKQQDFYVNTGPSVAPEIAALHERAKRAETLASHQAVLVGMLVELLDRDSLEAALDALAGAIKARFHCDRVAISLVDNGELRLSAVSQQAVIETSSSEARLLVDAMNETCVQEMTTSWPPTSKKLGVLAAHRALAGRRASSSICSVPLYYQQELVGVILLERRENRVFPVQTLERLSVALAPLLLLHLKADRDWRRVLKDSLINRFNQHLGCDRLGTRILCVAAALLMLCSVTITTDWQIIASAELLSHERRLVTSPTAGFVSEMKVTAGDRVVKGQLLAKLDRREMELEAASRDSEIVMAEAEFRAAMASYDRQTIGIARARLVQARARRAGLEQRLKRSDLVSPIDGLVIASDATRTTGTAVARGETMFEIAPSTDFEVHVLVDEADIYDVHTGQSGMLALRASPGDAIPIVVESIHPVAEASDGLNRFRVRANLEDPKQSLRPGQSGVVRLHAGRKSVLAVLTRRMNRRLAELWWKWVG